MIQSLQPYDLSGDSLSRFLSSVNHLVSFMVKNNETMYTPEVGICFTSTVNLDQGLGFRHCQRDNRMVKMLDAAMSCRLDEFYLRKPRTVRFPYPGELGKLAVRYLESDDFRCKMLALPTVDGYKRYLSRFCCAMQKAGKDRSNLERSDIAQYLASVTGVKYYKLQPVKCFLRYLYELSVIKEDLSTVLQKTGRSRTVPVLSYFEAEEITAIENSIARTSAVGKRDYAMVLLGSRLGLRRSDITNLEFENINWDRNEICIVQKKTGKPLTLPLVKEVGEALVDYIVHGRPVSMCPKVFVGSTQPYGPVSAATVTRIVSDAMTKACIDLRGRHHAAHALRHSLATQMLKEKVPMHVISSVLGHSTTEPTMAYLTVDIDMLLKCSMDVPPVENDFYEQRGGVLYGRV